MKISCCKECVPPKRHPGCHAKCEEYIAQKAALEEHKKKVASEVTREMALRDYDVDRHERVRKHYGG